MGVWKFMEFLNKLRSYYLYYLVGWSRNMWVSIRPGRRRAGSMSSGLELAATIYTPSTEATPSK